MHHKIPLAEVLDEDPQSLGLHLCRALIREDVPKQEEVERDLFVHEVLLGARGRIEVAALDDALGWREPLELFQQPTVLGDPLVQEDVGL